MTAQDRWGLHFFGHVVIRNGIKVARTVKKDASNFAESQTSTDRQDVWALPTSMESLGICVRGLAHAIELLVHPSAITAAEVTDLFRKLPSIYDKFDCTTSVSTLAEIFKDHLASQFARLRRFALKLDSEMPPRVAVITP